MQDHEVTQMSEATFTARDEPSLGPGRRAYRFACPHGVSSALLFSGDKPLDDRVVLELLLPGHHRSRQCACVPGVPAAVAIPRGSRTATPSLALALTE